MEGDDVPEASLYPPYTCSSYREYPSESYHNMIAPRRSWGKLCGQPGPYEEDLVFRICPTITSKADSCLYHCHLGRISNGFQPILRPISTNPRPWLSTNSLSPRNKPVDHEW